MFRQKLTPEELHIRKPVFITEVGRVWGRSGFVGLFLRQALLYSRLNSNSLLLDVLRLMILMPPSPKC